MAVETRELFGNIPLEGKFLSKYRLNKKYVETEGYYLFWVEVWNRTFEIWTVTASYLYPIKGCQRIMKSKTDTMNVDLYHKIVPKSGSTELEVALSINDHDSFQVYNDLNEQYYIDKDVESRHYLQ